ncbi:DUF721 domain-containing protein [Austwickia chelonae]|uniref:DUF721 domain-containing protein n=1 Tax=Austwickia chelonae TaxID=100225 RepID=UPI001F085980|nr:DciA family protein [Austwickia chelonae]
MDEGRPASRKELAGEAEGSSAGDVFAAEELPIESAVEAAAASALAKARENARSAGLRPSSGRIRSRAKARPSEYSGARADGRDPILVGDHLGRLLSERGWQVEVAVGSVISRWPAVVGPEVAQHVAPESFEDGVLTVRADSTSWATNLRYMVPLLLERLAVDVGEGKVTDLRIVGPASRNWRKGPRHSRW